MRLNRAKMALILLAVLILITACAHINTIKPYLNNPEFQAQNFPIRDLRLAVYTDGDNDSEINQLIVKTSETLKEQVGIRLKVVSFQLVAWERTDRGEMMKELYQRNKRDRATSKFDIAIGFRRLGAFETVVHFIIGGWDAMTDDTHRRYIVVRTANQYVLAHEICHTFIFSHDHSVTGLMQSVQISLFPGTPGINRTIYLSPKDREEILKNKWRDFNTRPQLRDENQTDLLNED